MIPIQKKFGPHHKIAHYGFSMSAAAMLMAETDAAAIIADSSYANLENMIKRQYSLFGPFKFPFVQATNLYTLLFFGMHPRGISPRDAVTGKSIPILIIHGSEDSQIPVENAHSLKEANPASELWIVEGTDHLQAASLRKTAYQKRIRAFLNQSLAK